MATDIPWSDQSIFDSYTIYQETFKTVSSHPIQTAILIPKNLPPGPRPLIYHLHGGFLVLAHGLFAPFYPKWLHKLALEQGAIVVSPDYRLLPSENGVLDILEDVEDGWTWTKKELNRVLSEKGTGVEADFERTLLAGGSAGGYLSFVLGLSHPDDFQALAAVYPLLDPKDHVYNAGPTASDPDILRIPESLRPSQEAVLSWIENSRREVTTKAGFELAPYAAAACHAGVFTSQLFDPKGLGLREFYPIDRVQAGEKLPKKIWVMHGDDDATVPIRGTDTFVNLVRERLPETEVRYDVVEGMDHGFEFEWKNWEGFSGEALGFVADAWLR